MTTHRRAQAGMSFIELVMVVSIIALLTAAAVPNYLVATEQARTDLAGASLRSVWVAQRMHWLETNRYGADLVELKEFKLIEDAFASQNKPFIYGIGDATSTTFIGEADRYGSSDWTGTISINDGGELTGSVTNGEGRSVTPIAP